MALRSSQGKIKLRNIQFTCYGTSVPHGSTRAFIPKGRSKVVHCRRSPFDVYIGRPSPWGNPFIIGRDGDRKQVIARYRQWVLTQPQLLRMLPSLQGKILGCWCKPLACHGDVLVELANQPEPSPR